MRRAVLGASAACLLVFGFPAADAARAANCRAQAQPIACRQTIAGALTDGDCNPDDDPSPYREECFYFDSPSGPTVSPSFDADFEVYVDLVEREPDGSFDLVDFAYAGVYDFLDHQSFQFAGRKYFWIYNDGELGSYQLALHCDPEPAPPNSVTPVTVGFPVGGGNFRLWVLINGNPAKRENACAPRPSASAARWPAAPRSSCG